MILKSIGRSTKNAYGNLANYIVRDQAVLKDSDGKPKLLTWNLQGQSIREMIAEFEANDALRKHTAKSIRATHDIISWSKESVPHLTPEIMEKIVAKYIELRGENGLYLGAIHTDKQPHLHLMVSASQAYTGDSMRISKARYMEIRSELNEFEKQFPGLEASYVDYSKPGKSLPDVEYQIEKRKGNKSKMHEVRDKLNEVYQGAKSKSDFYERIESEAGLSLYSRAGEIKGVDYEGMHMRLTTLGFTNNHMIELDQRQERLENIEAVSQPEIDVRKEEKRVPDEIELRLKELEDVRLR